MVRFEEREGADGTIGALWLDDPARINVLTIDMVGTLVERLTAWQDREDIKRVVITAAGERGFCAGGDVTILRDAILKNLEVGGIVDNLAEDFFESEYRLDYTIKSYPKPVICHGFGVVMGGGMGIFGSSAVRLATPRSRFAYPEVSIGLFPDAGATVFLRDLDIALARFFGATGALINAADAIRIGLAHHVVAADEDVVDLVCQADWRERLARSTESIEGMPDSELALVEAEIKEALSDPDLTIDGLRAGLDTIANASPWAAQARDKAEVGCPTTVGIVLEQINRSRSYGDADCFRLEMILGAQCARRADFPEGVRAVLIDRDAANWHVDWDSLTREHVLAHFEPPWPENPLADL